MPALSFQEEWLDKLLRGDKQQTTRPQTTRIWIGDPIVHIYNQQRRRIADKPLRLLTKAGIAMMPMDRYPFPSNNPPMHYAHFLGKVEITEVYDFVPMETHETELEAWAHADGFEDMINASDWFTHRYSNDWVYQTWTVIKWNGWTERYFKPD